MTEFIPIEILCSSVINESEIIVRVLDMISLESRICLYDTIHDKFYEIDTDHKYIMNNFLEYTTKNKIRPHIVPKITETKTVALHKGIKIYHFDRSIPTINTVNYSLKIDKGLFVPCLAKHDDHETIISQWGKYTESFSIGPGVNTSGYIVTNIDNFDRYILKTEELLFKYDTSMYKKIILGEFKDYISSLDSEQIVSLKCVYRSGKEIEVDL